MARLAGSVLCLIAFAAALAAQDPKAKQEVKKEPKQMSATVVKVDSAKKVIRIRTPDGRQTDLKVDDATKFMNASGVLSDLGLNDDRLRAAAPIRIVFDGTTVKEVQLLARSLKGAGAAKPINPPISKDAKPASSSKEDKKEVPSKDK